MKKIIAGGSSNATGLQVALPRTHLQPRRSTRLLESEGLLAGLLLTPTVVLLGIFIALSLIHI